jgi:hypothetical protein
MKKSYNRNEPGQLFEYQRSMAGQQHINKKTAHKSVFTNLPLCAVLYEINEF